MSLEKDNIDFIVNNPYMEVLGAAIRQAIDDFVWVDPKSNRGTHFNSACFYLFSIDGLEEQIQASGLLELLDISAIRSHAINSLKRQVKMKTELASEMRKERL
jgi:hypothetical protein